MQVIVTIVLTLVVENQSHNSNPQTPVPADTLKSIPSRCAHEDVESRGSTSGWPVSLRGDVHICAHIHALACYTCLQELVPTLAGGNI